MANLSLEALRANNLTVTGDGDIKVAGQVVRNGEQKHVAQEMEYWLKTASATSMGQGRELFVASVVKVARATAIKAK